MFESSAKESALTCSNTAQNVDDDSFFLNDDDDIMEDAVTMDLIADLDRLSSTSDVGGDGERSQLTSRDLIPGNSLMSSGGRSGPTADATFLPPPPPPRQMRLSRASSFASKNAGKFSKTPNKPRKDVTS